jgi:hypothetical protein
MAQNLPPKQPVQNNLPNLSISRGVLFGAILITALMAFEIFNYGTTDYALTDLLGDLKFAGLRWSTILAIAFCGIDFAGIARLFAPEMTREHNENWFLFSAWLLAATMNASLTWWGVSLAILNHQTQGSSVIAHETMIRVAPVFVAILVWLIRVLIIGTFSMNSEQFFSARPVQQVRATQAYRPGQPAYRPMSSRPAAPSRPVVESPAAITTSRPAAAQPAPHSFSNPRRFTSPPPEPEYEDEEEVLGRSEPVYAKAPLAARPAKPNNANSGRRF